MEAQDIHIDRALHTPIVQQIVDRIQEAIECGRLGEDSRLPSVREMAGAHRIHAMTVSTAYQRLVALGLLERRRGARLRVCSARLLSDCERLARLDQHLHQILNVARSLGLEETTALVRLGQLLGSSTARPTRTQGDA